MVEGHNQGPGAPCNPVGQDSILDRHGNAPQPVGFGSEAPDITLFLLCQDKLHKIEDRAGTSLVCELSDKVGMTVARPLQTGREQIATCLQPRTVDCVGRVDTRWFRP